MMALSRKSFFAVSLLVLTPPIASVARPIVFATLTQGNHSGITTFSQVVVRSPTGWAALWRGHAAGTKIPRVPPAVDFSRKMVIGVFFGAGPVGRRTSISAVVERDGQLIVSVQMVRPPGPEADDLPQITPFHIVQLARSPLPVIFIPAKIPDLYQPSR